MHFICIAHLLLVPSLTIASSSQLNNEANSIGIGNASEVNFETFRRLFVEKCAKENVAERNKFDYIMKHNGSPKGMNPTGIGFQFRIEEVLEVDDLRKTMTVAGTILMFWGNLVCAKSLRSLVVDKFDDHFKMTFIVDIAESWYPLLRHVNAAADKYPIENQVKVVHYDLAFRNNFLSMNQRLAAKITARIQANLRLTSNCDNVSFEKFPFDRLSCGVGFMLEERADMLKFWYLGESPKPNLKVDESDIWQLEDPLEKATKSNRTMNAVKYEYLEYRIKLKRKTFYYIGNIFIPIAILVLVQQATFLMPPENDRPAFSVTVVLSFYVALQSVSSTIPRTSERVHLLDVILFEVAMSAAITCYCLITSALVLQKWTQKPVRIGKLALSKIRIMDAVCFSVSISITVAYAACEFSAMAT